MGQCMYCERKGFFLAVNKHNLCTKCAPAVDQMVKRHIQIIKESEKLVNTSKNYDTRISRCDDVIRNVEHLNEFKIKGYKINADLDVIVSTYISIKNTLIQEYAREKVKEFLQKATLAKTLNTKLSNANKAIVHLKDLNDKYGFYDESLLTLVKQFTHKAEFEDLLEKAEKEEFKGNNKKAIDKYKDILFFLKKDDIDDTLQEPLITRIEAKIRELIE